jgi:hypothetical protein
MLRLIVVMLALAAPAAAHQPSETLLRQVLVERGWFSTLVTVRLPATLLYAPAAAARAHPGAPVQAPLLRAERRGGGWHYRLEPAAAPEALAPLLGRAVRISIGGRAARPATVRLLDARTAPPLGTSAPGAHSGTAGIADAHISQVLVEARYRRWWGGAVRLGFPVDGTALPPFVHLETAVEDRRTGATLWRVGPLSAPLELPP